MNSKVKKGIFWGGIVASIILVMNVFHNLFGGLNALAAGPHGHGPRGLDRHSGFGQQNDIGLQSGFAPHHGFGPQHMMGPHHSGFSWIWFLFFLILGIVVLVLVVKWLRRKSKASAMQQFIDTSLLNSHRPLANQNGNVLDQWEKNLINKKEIE